jgi:HAMP domain-containing protein
MGVSELPGSQIQNLPAPGIDPTAENRIQSIRLLTVFVCVLAALLTAGLVVLLFSQFTWQIAVLAGLYTATTLFCLFSLNSLYPRGSYTWGIAGVSFLFGLAVLGTAVFLSGIGFPAAIVYLIFTLIVSSFTLNDRQANLTIVVGILIAGLAGLATDFSPFPQITVELISILTPAILGVLFMVYVTMQVMQFVTATLRIRLVTIFIAIVVVPLSILSIVQSGFMFNELTREINQAQRQASGQVAYAVDQFIENSQDSVREAARLPSLARYLELPEEKRTGSAEEKEMQLAMQVLDAKGTRGDGDLSSFALLEMNGLNLYDTLSSRIMGLSPADIDLASSQPGQGSSEGAENYFLVPARSGVPYISQVYITTSSRGFIFISAPIKNSKGQTVGVLRARYDGMLLQDLLKQFNGLLGSQSYPILLDDNNIRLADQFTPYNLYKSIAPLTAEQIRVLKANGQLPDLPDSTLSTNFGEFNQLINNYQKSPVFRTEINAAGGEDAFSEIAAVTKVNTMPWKLVYLRANLNDGELRSNQRKLTTMVTILIAGVVGLIAVGASQLLSSPIMRLTRTAQRISEGDLDAQAPSQSTDEFGVLGSAFNSMTSQLRLSITELEDRVKARTEEIEKQNAVLSHRADQLQIVSEVARQIVSAQELEALLSSVTRLISERFGFYHVGVFLLDEKKENAVLRAANSAGGQRMLTRHHSLPVGRIGLVG